MIIENHNRVHFVLTETSHPGNIGAAARAMKTMGFHRLVLVRPKIFPHPEATAMASGAEDILQQAIVCNSLEEATANCRSVLGLSARERRISAPCAELPQLGEWWYAQTLALPMALVFGRERSGLTNDELDLCDTLVHIPSNPVYSSLNLAAAVQVVAYTLLSQTPDETPTPEQQPVYPTADQWHSFYPHLQKVIHLSGFKAFSGEVLTMRRLRCLCFRAHPTAQDLQLLRGLLTAMERSVQSRNDHEEN